MDKKEAEQEALKKAKNIHAAAGKSSGLSGRDLVCGSFSNIMRVLIATQFSYNPEWFDQEDGEEEEEWDISKYRREIEESEMQDGLADHAEHLSLHDNVNVAQNDTGQ